MNSTLVILNPYAGRGGAQRARRRLEEALHRGGVRFDLVATRGPGHAHDLAAEAQQCGVQRIVAAGGDGTVNEVINGMAQATADDAAIATLALCPMGGGNDFADMLGCPRRLDAIVQRIQDGQIRHVDLASARFTSAAGTEAVRYFANNMGVGFEAQVTLNSQRIARVGGAARYALALLQTLRMVRCPQVEVAWEQATGEWVKRQQPSLMVSIGNSPRTGGYFYMAPQACMDDGLLNLGLTRQMSALGVLRLLVKVLMRIHLQDRAVEADACRRLVFHCTETMPVHIDGEIILEDARRISVSVASRRLHVIA